MIPAARLATSDVTRDLLERIEYALDTAAPDAVVLVSTRDDDPEQPSPFGVWLEGPEEGDGDTVTDLIGAGESIDEALADALKEVETWA